MLQNADWTNIILALNLESSENTAIQKKIVCIISLNARKLNFGKQSYKGTHISVPLVPKV